MAKEVKGKTIVVTEGGAVEGMTADTEESKTIGSMMRAMKPATTVRMMGMQAVETGTAVGHTLVAPSSTAAPRTLIQKGKVMTPAEKIRKGLTKAGLPQRSTHRAITLGWEVTVGAKLAASTKPTEANPRWGRGSLRGRKENPQVTKGSRQPTKGDVLSRWTMTGVAIDDSNRLLVTAVTEMGRGGVHDRTSGVARTAAETAGAGSRGTGITGIVAVILVPAGALARVIANVRSIWPDVMRSASRK